MPYNHRFPILYDECRTIAMSDLIRWNYIQKHIRQAGYLRWTRHGVDEASLNFLIDYTTDYPYMELKYTLKQDEESVDYRINITTVPSNLGNGDILYFECPFTHKRCRKLYLLNSRYAHRSLVKGAYTTQTYSSHTRCLIQQFGRLKRSEDAYMELYGKHFKKFYKNKPTKRYLKLLKDLYLVHSKEQ